MALEKESRLSPDQLWASFASLQPRCHEPASFARLRERNPFPGYNLGSWPILLDPAAAAKMQEQSVALSAIARSLPGRLLAGDAARIAAYYGLEGGAAMAELILSPPNGIDAAVYRGDYLVTPAGLRCLELNAGSGMAGLRVPALAALYPEVPVIAEFLGRYRLRLRYRDTFYELLAHILRGLRSIPAFRDAMELDTAIAVVGSEDLFQYHGAAPHEDGRRIYAAALAAVAPGVSGELAFCDYEELELRPAGVYRGGRRLHALFEQQVDRGSAGRQLFGSFKAGRIALHTGPATRIIMDKCNLALMSEHQDDSIFDDAERRILRTLVPWTRRVLAESTRYRGESVFLPDLLANERERLVLKRAFSHSGKGVHLGRDTPPARWTELAAAALADRERWVMQEALESVPYALLDDQLGVVPHEVVWGLYAFGGAFQGGYLRVAARQRRLLLNLGPGVRVLPYLEAEPLGAIA